MNRLEGEELWSPSAADIKALKDTESDLSPKHLRAFDHCSLAPTACVPDASEQVQQPEGEAPPLVAIPL